MQEWRRRRKANLKKEPNQTKSSLNDDEIMVILCDKSMIELNQSNNNNVISQINTTTQHKNKEREREIYLPLQ